MARLQSALRRARQRSGLKQGELAARAGISRQTLSVLESARAEPTTLVALRLCWIAASSDAALKTLARGQAHVAGAHLFDEEAREYNVPFVRRAFGGRSMIVITFAHLEEGFAVARGNPLRIRKPEHIARPGVRFVNREPGAGARRLLDRLLRKARIPA